MLSFCAVLRWGRMLISLLMLPSLLSAAAQNTGAPTTSDDPALIDHVWQQASSKYDSAREALLKRADGAKGPFRADWESLRKYEVPEWYKDAKFGIFIHWGLYSVPAFASEWYPRNMYREGSEEYKHHVATYGPPEKFGYKDFIPMFKAEHYDPAAWAELFKKAGAKYVVPVAEHHDGFAMYDSEVSDWTAAKMGPHRDLIGDLAKAVRAAGLHFGVSSHRVEHNFFLDVGRSIPSDVSDRNMRHSTALRIHGSQTRGELPSTTISRMFRRRGRMIGLHAPQSWSRNIILTSCTSTGGLDIRRSARI